MKQSLRIHRGFIRVHSRLFAVGSSALVAAEPLQDSVVYSPVFEVREILVYKGEHEKTANQRRDPVIQSATND
jgi:hypothetical protein